LFFVFVVVVVVAVVHRHFHELKVIAKLLQMENVYGGLPFQKVFWQENKELEIIINNMLLL